MSIRLSRLFLRCDRSAPRRAREALRRLEGIDAVREDALLLTSELVSSAVLRTGCDPREAIEVVADLVPNGIRISVADVPESRQGPRLGGSDDAYLPAGLGLRLVDAIARRWGVDSRGDAQLWAELAV